jgi:hypothetical protein
MYRGGFVLDRGGWLLRLPVPRYQAVLRFHIPLSKLDGPYSGIRLSDGGWSFIRSSHGRTRETPARATELVKAQLKVLVSVRESCVSRAPDLVLPAEPSTEPTRDVVVHHVVRPARSARVEVVRPAAQFPAQPDDPLLLVQQGPTARRLLPDREQRRISHYASTEWAHE